MDITVRALADQHQELDSLLAGLDAEDWKRASRCQGWPVPDVVLHLAQTDELALASGRGRFVELVRAAGGAGTSGDVDAAAALAVARERGQAGPAVHERWRSSAAGVRTMFAGCDPRRRLAWVAGELAVGKQT